MARAHFVKKARKANKAAGIKKGDSYYWWKFRRGGKRISKTPPRRSQLTQSEFYGVMYDCEDTVADAGAEFVKAEDADTSDLVQALRDAVTSIEEQRDQCQERFDNMEQAFSGGCPTMELLETRVSNCDDIIQSLEQVADDLEGEEGPAKGETHEQWRERCAQKLEEVSWDYE